MSQPSPDARSRYFDINGSTPLDPQVAELCAHVQLESYGNAAASHPEGRRARAIIDTARERIARAIDASPEEIWFTSGGTESNNWALFGSAGVSERRHLVVSAIEHKSVLASARELERRGYELTLIAPQPSGAVHLRDVEAAVRPDTLLVSIMWANNETGVVQPVREIAALCRARGVRFHTDAVCVLGKLPVSVRVERVGGVDCDLMSLTGHKLHAPKGCGVLYVRRGVELSPYVHGCGQQSGMRSGSENTAGAAGFGLAASLIEREAFHPSAPFEELRRQLWNGIEQRFPGARRNGSGALIPNTLNVYFPGCPAVELQAALAERGYSVAAGASAAGSSLAGGQPLVERGQPSVERGQPSVERSQPSHVLLAMGLGAERARSSLRFSLGRDTTSAAIAGLLVALEEAHTDCSAAVPRASVSLEV